MTEPIQPSLSDFQRALMAYIVSGFHVPPWLLSEEHPVPDYELFLQAIDAHPGDLTYLLVLSDWLLDRGDARASAWRWLGVEGKVPLHLRRHGYFWLGYGPWLAEENVTASLPWLKTTPRDGHATASVAYAWAVAELLARGVPGEGAVEEETQR